MRLANLTIGSTFRFSDTRPGHFFKVVSLRPGLMVYRNQISRALALVVFPSSDSRAVCLVKPSAIRKGVLNG